MVWVVEYINEGMSSHDHAISVWDTEEAARKHVCAELMNFLREEIANIPEYLTDPLFMQEAKELSSYITDGSYKEAICYWNSSNFNNGYQVWMVFPEQIRDLARSGNPVPFDPNFFNSKSEEKPAETEEFVASKPGATCRICPNYNEYAYADQPDGTYVCRSCKMMNQVFGSKG